MPLLSCEKPILCPCFGWCLDGFHAPFYLMGHPATPRPRRALHPWGSQERSILGDFTMKTQPFTVWILSQPNGYYMGCRTVNGGDYNEATTTWKMENLANKTMDCTDFGATIGDWMNQDRYRLEFQTQGDKDSYDISCDTHTCSETSLSWALNLPSVGPDQWPVRTVRTVRTVPRLVQEPSNWRPELRWWEFCHELYLVLGDISRYMYIPSGNLT